jgi:LacI family transcriptional regulator
MAVTLKQIADKLSVDISTVSRAMDEREKSRLRVNEKTRSRVLSAAQKMGYEKNFAAQALVRRRTGCVGILLPDLDTPLFVRYANTFDRLLSEKSLRAIPMVYHNSSENERELLQSLRRGQVDAMICLYYHKNFEPLYQSLRKQGHNLIFRALDRPIDKIDYDCVGTDVAHGYEILVKHLYKNGYRKIGIVGGSVAKVLAAGDEAKPGSPARFFLDAHSKVGLEFDPSLAVPCENDSEDVCNKLSNILQCDRERFDALTLFSNNLVIGAWLALQKAEIRIGEQVGLVVQGDSKTCHLLNITAWEQPVEQISKSMIQIIDARLKGRKELTKIQYASWLIERESSRGPQKVNNE